MSGPHGTANFVTGELGDVRYHGRLCKTQ
jgi:hypothetical protein